MDTSDKTSKFAAIYLGDSVYMKFDGFGLEIYLSNGYGHENVIMLEPEVFKLLVKYGTEALEDKTQ